MNYQGYIIYRERVRRNWSQAGLCKGICTVSYLSKIESGRAEPSEEILRLLLARLNLETNREIEREAAGLAARGWELLLTGRRGQLRGLLRERDIERYRAVPAWLDLALLSAQTPLEPALEPCMDVQQLAVQRILQRQEAEAVRLMPNAYTHLHCRLQRGQLFRRRGRLADRLRPCRQGGRGAAHAGSEALSRQRLLQPAGSAQHGAPLSGGAAAGGGFAG